MIIVIIGCEIAVYKELDSDFKFSIIQTLRTLRLRGINTKELQTEQGRKTKEYIEAKVLNLPFVVIKTYSRDIYLRYLADVFYLPDNEDVNAVAEKGKYLNQELIDVGLAERYWRWQGRNGTGLKSVDSF